MNGPVVPIVTAILAIMHCFPALIATSTTARIWMINIQMKTIMNITVWHALSATQPGTKIKDEQASLAEYKLSTHPQIH